MRITIPELSLVVLIGASGSGKSTFAREHFKSTEVLSSDFCRGLVSDDENDQSATPDAFDVLHYIMAKRLAAGRLTVIDATNVQEEARRPLVALAREYHCLPVAIVFNLPEQLCRERNRERQDRQFGPHVIRNHCQQLRRSLRGLGREGFRYVHVLSSPEEVAAVTIERQPLWNNRRFDRGPFDIIGDVHGCYDELRSLLEKLGYEVAGDEVRPPEDGRTVSGEGEAPAEPASVAGEGEAPAEPVPGSDDRGGMPVTGSAGASPSQRRAGPPYARKVVFLGDLVDRGPAIPAVLRLVMGMVEAGTALCIPGNHDVKLLRKLQGRDVRITHGLADSLAQLEAETPEFRAQVVKFLDGLVSHYVLDEGRLVVAHAGLKAEMQGRGSGRVRDFALYGETTGETDEFGLPVRYNWALEYRGRSMVVYGHTPVPEAEWLNRTINIDTGCVFGGKLTALRYPEEELVSVPAARTYAEPVKPFLAEEERAPLSAQQQQDDLLDIESVLGKRLISTRLHRNITIREENAIAALEVMSRFAANPKWLIYLPPTMSPPETTRQPGLLEHPAEAFAYYRHMGLPRVVCEEKHMGSRAVVVVCRDEEAARRRFGVTDEGYGLCYTRTGRRFFTDAAYEAGLLERVRTALDRAGAWEEFGTEWFCLDCELLPWSAKAEELLREQYAPVGAAARAALAESVAALTQAEQRLRDAGLSRPVPETEAGEAADATSAPSPSTLRARYQARAEAAADYIDAYRRYCWPVRSVDDIQLAPFHLLATEGTVHVHRDHVWHMETLGRLFGTPVPTGSRSPFRHTEYRVVDVTDPASELEGIAWWEALTGSGGEGMVVKPLEFIARGRRGLAQPGVKCRGREYLRIIYGPEYTAPVNLDRLRARSVSGKRSLALREFALGIESLERFVRREPLYRVHECVFGVLALESEPVDPRL